MHQRNRLLHGKEGAARVDGEDLVEMFRGHGPHWRHLHEACADDEIVEAALLGLHPTEEPVEVFELRDIALYSRNIPSDRGLGLVQFRLTAAGDEDVGPLPTFALREFPSAFGGI